MRKPVSRGAVFWGAALVTAGLVVLALQQGLLTEDLVGQAEQWWPLILIGAGVAVIFSGALGVIAVGLAGVLVGVLIGGFIGGAASFPTTCGTGDPPPLEALEEGTFSGAADVEVELNCMTLEIAGGSGDAWAVEADDETAGLLEMTDDSRELAVRTDESDVFGSSHRLHVGVTIPADTGTSLTTRLNAGDATLDLADGEWGALVVEGNAVSISADLSGATADEFLGTLNAGSMSVALDGDSEVESVELRGNAASFDVCIPDGVGVEVTVAENVATGHNLDEAGLIDDGDVWRTPDFESADAHVEITFSGNAASFNLNPDGGCS